MEIIINMKDMLIFMHKAYAPEFWYVFYGLFIIILIGLILLYKFMFKI